MSVDPIAEYLQQLSLEQLESIQSLVARLAEKKSMAVIERQRLQDEEAAKRQKKVVGLPPSPPKDLNALADAAGLDISSLLKDVNRRSR